MDTKVNDFERMDKRMKKKKWIPVWVIGAIIIGAGLAGLAGSDEPTQTSTPTVKEEVATEDVSTENTEQGSESEVDGKIQESETKEASNNAYSEIGDAVSVDGKNITILDIGLYDGPGTGYNGQFMYVLTEIENISEEEQTIWQESAIYVDDYQQEPAYLFEITVDDITGNAEWISLNPGRKCKYIFYTSISDEAYKADKVEFEVYGSLDILFKDNGNWRYGVYGSDTTTTTNTTEVSSGDGIGNPIIDANPDRYIPEGITGEIDGIDDGFYADSGNIDLVPGEYYIIGGGSAILTITENAISMSGGKNNFENADIKLAENGAPQYWVYVNGNYYAVVSFYDGGLYFRTNEADGEEDWDEGFYSKF